MRRGKEEMGRLGILFDMDGVLVDTEPFYFEISRALFARLGIAVPEERLSGFVGISAVLMWTGLRQEFGLARPVEELMQLERAAQLDFFLGLPEIPVVSGIVPLLEEIRARGIPLAVASSSSRRLILTILDRTGLLPFFDAVVSGEEVARGKPAPDIFVAAAGKLSVPPSCCLVIEDSTHGIAGARAAGMRTIGYLNPHSGDQDLSAADEIIRAFSPEAIRRITRAGGR